MRNLFRYFKSSPEVIRLTVMFYIRYPLSLRQVEDILFERGIDICHETVRFWWNRFGPMFAAEIRKRRVQTGCYSQWRWHLDEVFVKINGETRYLWRAVDHEGEVLEVFATKRRDRKAALKLRSTREHRDGPASIIPGGDECNRHFGSPGMWPVAQQSSRKFTPAIPKTGRGNVEIQGPQNPTEVLVRPCLDPKSFQSGPPPQSPRYLQAEPFCRSGRMASAGGLNLATPGNLQTGSH